MIPVRIEMRDGRMTMDRVDEGRYEGWNSDYTISETLWNAYKAHREQDDMWQEIIGHIDNTSYGLKKLNKDN